MISAPDTPALDARAQRAVRRGALRATAGATAGIALLMFLFEAVKTAVWPAMTLWESHAVTIVFSTLFGAIAVAVTLRR
jgi:hypothetical protein